VQAYYIQSFPCKLNACRRRVREAVASKEALSGDLMEIEVM
jgi:hypothetical protein